MELGWDWGGRKKDTDRRHLNYSSEKEKEGKNQILFCLNVGKDRKLALGSKFPNTLCVSRLAQLAWLRG